MKKSIAILAILSLVSAEKLVFSDDFSSFNLKTWQHELTLSGGGNWEFEWYVNNRTNSYVRDGVLYLKPSLTEDAIGTNTMKTGTASIWGGSPADMCTSNNFWGCERSAAGSGNYINPIRSARLRTVNSFSFTYGRVEIKAKLPKGDWIWPAIWMLPTDQQYGSWPASGEIDIMESRGNSEAYLSGGHDSFGSTLHWGQNWDSNQYAKTHKDYKHTESLGNDFHTYGLYWDESGLYTYLDDPTNKVLEVDFTTQSFWERAGYPTTSDNPWVGESNAAPFNKDFHLIFNLAVGGTNAYFPDGVGNKPWSNGDSHSVNAFYNAKDQWYSTWKGEDAALQIDSVKVWSFETTTEAKQTFL